MLDVNDFIAEREGNPDRLRENQKLRGEPVEQVDKIIEAFQIARKEQYAVTTIGSEINAVQKQIGQKKKAKEDCQDLLDQKIALEKSRKNQEKLAEDKKQILSGLVKNVGNYIEKSVPVSQTEDDNEVVHKWTPEGFDETKKAALSHHEVLQKIGAFDQDRGAKVSGHRAYYLTGPGVLLNQALIQYGIHFLMRKGFIPCQPPYFINGSLMRKTVQLSDFEESIYSLGTEQDDIDKKFLIATSEQPISAMHSSEWLVETQLPIKYCGYSTCFRKEAGKHGKEAWGLFRVHQFEKIEQFLYSKPSESWKHFDEMLLNSKEFIESLGLPYRVVAIVSGALNHAAAKKCDLEAWFGFQQEFKELVSVSNCTDYQSRELEVRYGHKKAKEAADAKKEYVHMLNGTLCATERTLCCIAENYQTEDGMVVPEVLRRYMPDLESHFPYLKTDKPDLAKDVAKLSVK